MQAKNAENTPTILIVDDNQNVLELLMLLLTKHGLTVVGASSGAECLEIVKARPIDLVILDVMMPTMDGLHVCQRLKETHPSLPVILVTARDDMMTRAAAMDLGVSEFVAKPVNNQDLIARIRTQLRAQQWDRAADDVFAKIDVASPGDLATKGPRSSD